ncbi:MULTISPECIES: hypothetical protein [unclassified Ornithinimicrobium]|uniref:hypothetical protein n=1 Tax=unclassified Ornithinimicrobium TaxID=2615080 RepID=UPI0038522B88
MSIVVAAGRDTARITRPGAVGTVVGTAVGTGVGRGATPTRSRTVTTFFRWSRRATVVGWLGWAVLVVWGVLVLTSVGRHQDVLTGVGPWALMVYALVIAATCLGLITAVPVASDDPFCYLAGMSKMRCRTFLLHRFPWWAS